MNRLEFAHILRAFAAFAVAVSHFVGVFWASQNGVADLLGVSPLPVGPEDLVGAQAAIEYDIVLGQFGVGVFFLISGLVIPLSFHKKTRSVFVVERIFRIYPVYIVGFTVCVLSIYIVEVLYSGIFPYSVYEIFVHYFLMVRQWVGTPKIDGISWTLEIEIIFYIFIALFMNVIYKNPMSSISIIAIILAISSYYFFSEKNTWYIGRQLTSLYFMFIGVSFSLFYRKNIKIYFFSFYVSINTIIFSFIYFNSYLSIGSWQWTYGYILAAIVFSLAFFCRDYFGKIGILSHFADISYPFYVVHALTGYSLLYSLLKNGFSPWMSVGIVFCTVYAISVAVHKFVERPMMAYGKTLARKLR